MPSTDPSSLPDELRAMSVHFPFAWLIVRGFKTEEYRSRSTNLRGWILIHSSSSKESDQDLEYYGIPQSDIVRKAIVGAVRLVDCYWREDLQSFAYILDNPILFPEPIPASGQQSVFWPASTDERIKAFTKAWQYLWPYAETIDKEGLPAKNANHNKNSPIDTLAYTCYPHDVAEICAGLKPILLTTSPFNLLEKYNGAILLHACNYIEGQDDLELAEEIFDELGVGLDLFPENAIHARLIVSKIKKYDSISWEADRDKLGMNLSFDQAMAVFNGKEIDLCGIEIETIQFLKDPICDVSVDIAPGNCWYADQPNLLEAFKIGLDKSRPLVD